MENDIRLVLLETSGNQAYIFGTNKMREIMGASELIHRTGTLFVERAIQEAFGTQFQVINLDNEPPIESRRDGVEVITATSGKALLLIDGENRCKKFIRAWSLHVATEAPGLDATAVFSSKPVSLELETPDQSHLDIASAMRDVHDRFETARTFRISPIDRFQRLPVVAECQSSGGPAAEWYDPKSNHQSKEPPVALSRECIAKRDARASGEFEERFKRIFRGLGDEEREYFDNPNRMEEALGEDLEWVAVAHADGNGLGQVFLNFGKWIQHLRQQEGGENEWLKETRGLSFGRLFIETYRRMSRRLDEITRLAFLDAVKEVLIPAATGNTDRKIPLVPVVLGGDDLTVMVDGRYAIPLVRRFLEAHGELVATDRGALHAVLSSAKDLLGAPGIGMSAGISITKPHFPFSTSYDLAEELVRSAKRVKRLLNPASSSLDFHILYDSSATSIRDIRDRLTRNGAILTSKPFVVRSAGTASDPNWVQAHEWERLARAASALRLRRKDGRRVLPSSQAHAIREALHRQTPPQVEKGIWNMLREAGFYKDFFQEWKEVYSNDALFAACPRSDVPEGQSGDWRMTVFQDALEAEWFLD